MISLYQRNRKAFRVFSPTSARLPPVNYIMSGIMFETPEMVRKSMLGISRRMGIVSGKPVSTPE
jgi:hypothetical protein